MEQQQIENEIRVKGKEWIDEYGEEFLVELIGDYLEDGSVRLARLRQAADTGDAESLMIEAHTLKSSAASLGAHSLSVLAKRLEEMSRNGDLSALANDLARFEELFALVKTILENLRAAPGAFLAAER